MGRRRAVFTELACHRAVVALRKGAFNGSGRNAGGGLTIFKFQLFVPAKGLLIENGHPLGSRQVSFFT
jgi:hypothetical protein